MSGTTTAAAAPTTPATKDTRYWSDIENIRKEWPASQLDHQDAITKWQQAMMLYDNDDYGSMMQCASLFSTALAHFLYGEGILHGDDFPNTVFKTLYSCLKAPPDGKTFAETAQRGARLVLTLIRENGWQPPSMGGQGLFDNLIMDKGNYILLSTAIGPPNRPWEGDLKSFFAVPPQPALPRLPNPDSEDPIQVVNSMYNTLQKANAGDNASEFHMNGMALWANGQAEEGLASLIEAAKLGSVNAMKDAGDLAGEMGRTEESRFWFESAANAGHPGAMWNMAVCALQGSDFDTAAAWYQRSAEAGLADGYAALTQMARDRNDAAAMRHWARLGAEAGQTFCMAFHGMYLSMDANGDVQTLRRAREFLEQAADRGDVSAATMAVSSNFQLGDQARGRRFIQMVFDSGDQEEIDRLHRYGYL